MDNLVIRLREVACARARDLQIAAYGPGGGNPSARPGDQITWEAADRITELERRVDELFTHEAVDAFWRVWDEIGKPHIHGVYESTWAAFRSALDKRSPI